MEVQKFQTLTELQGSDYPVHIDFLLARGFSKEFRFTVLENGSPWTPSGQWTYELLGIDQTSPMIIKTYPDGGIEYDPETSELVFTISAEEIANFEYNVYGHRLSWIDLSDDIDPTYKLYITGETTIRSGKEIPADLYTINDVKDIVGSDQIETHNLSPRSHPYLLNLILDTQADVVALRTTVESSQADIDSRITELNDNLTAIIDANTEELTALINQSNEDLTTLIQSTENDLYQSLSTTSTRLLYLIDTNTKRLDVLGTNFANYQTKTDYTLSVLSSNYNQLSRQHNADIQRLESEIHDMSILSIEVVDTLPEVGENGILYLVPDKDEEESNYYNEFIWINNAWELIGTTALVIDNYVTYDDALTEAQINRISFDSDLGLYFECNNLNFSGSLDYRVTDHVRDTYWATLSFNEFQGVDLIPNTSYLVASILVESNSEDDIDICLDSCAIDSDTSIVLTKEYYDDTTQLVLVYITTTQSTIEFNGMYDITNMGGK